ncbi:MAG: hypothetical protein ACYTKD_24530 [Planctomycetota bacterium]
MRRASGTVLAALAACAALASAAHALETEGVLSRERPVRVMTGPHGYRRVRRGAKSDPVPPLGDGDLALFKGGLTSSEVKRLLDGYRDRMLAAYSSEQGFPAGLAEFLGANRDVAEVFVTAIDPQYDDLAGGAKVFDELRAADAKLLEKYVHLATALAVVYDTPEAVPTSRYLALWGVTAEQFYPLPKVREVWDYYTDRKLKPRFGFALEKLPWPILAHLVDNDVNDEDRKWSLSKYNGRTTKVARLYPSVKYDYDKLNRKGTKLGQKPYTLPNLLKYGGVCVDQAHFSSRVAKCLGVPAMKVTGHGRFGGSGHAWTGFLVIKKGRPLLEFTGRYFMDYYYTGDVFDPQTRTMTLDRFVAMMYDGASLSYPKYNQSRMLVRMAEAVKAEHPAEALELTLAALKLNYFNMWGWPLLMESIKDGTLAKKDGLEWFNKMLKGLREHPDMTYYCLGTFIGCIPEGETRKRQSLYTQAARLYGERPDLLIKLRLEQTGDLCRAGQKRAALNILMPTVVENSKEGKLVLPAMRRSVELATELGLGRAAYNVLKRADKDFPKMRGTTPSKAYADFQALLESLK